MLSACALLPLLLPGPSSALLQEPGPVIGQEDFVYCYWPVNFRPWPTWPAFRKVRHVSAGTYGLLFDTAAGDILRMGRPATAAGGADASRRYLGALRQSEVARRSRASRAPSPSRAAGACG